MCLMNYGFNQIFWCVIFISSVFESSFINNRFTNGKMLRNSFTWYIFAFTLFELVIKTHLTFYDGSHGFITKNPRYFDDDISNIHEDISMRYAQKAESKTKWKLRFDPESLDFRHRPLGIPHSETVTFFNEDNHKTIDMTSISGNTVHFHSSFFEDKKIPPNGNTSFKVVFLGRNEGPVESNLFIHTSDGFMKYNVRAFGSFSPYKLRPIVGVKIPINSTFSPLIYLHNPHSEPIQVVEIYSSGGGFHLELPSGKQEGPNDLWEILPQETKAVIRVRFHAKMVQNHTAYVRIKLHEPDEILIVPLEVEVTSSASVFHPQGSVDFGMGGDMDPQKEIDFCLFNPTKKAVRVHSVSTTSKAIKAQYYNIRINPGSEKENVCVHVGTLTLDWKVAWKTQDYHGKIVVKFRNGKNRTEIPYHLSVLKGGIAYDTMATTYFLNEKGVDLSMRSFEARNEFEYPLKVINITFPFDADSIFKVETFTPKTIQPNERQNLFNIKLKNSVKKSDMTLSSYITLHTNISEMTVPLLSYNGKLQVHLPFQSEDYSLDVGLIGYNAKKEVFFLLANPNPVTLHITSVKSAIPMTQVEIYGCGNGDHKEVLLQYTFKNLTKCHSIRSKHHLVIKMTVVTTQIEGQVWGDIQIETPFENLSVPVHFRISQGKFEVGGDKFVFDYCFPGKICSHPLKVTSTFEDKMVIEDIMSLPDDIRMSYTHTTVVQPKSSRILGHLFIAPHLECEPNCYSGLPKENSANWLKTFANPKHMSEFDLHLVNVFYNRYLNVTANGLKEWQNLTFRIDTTEVRGHIFKSRVKLVWPKLLLNACLQNSSLLEFPLTQMGNFSTKGLLLHNPASYTIVVQLMFDRDYAQVDMLFDGLPSVFAPPLDESYSPSSSFQFENQNLVDSQVNHFNKKLDLHVMQSTLPFVLLPGQTEEIKISFHSRDTEMKSGLLFIRNNLTVLEVVKLKGRGAIPLFKFGNRKPGSSQPLMFEMTDRHLRDCERLKSHPNPQPNLSVKRTFTARNMGDITIYVHKFYVNNYECEGYGFKVIDCEPFSLPPNSTKKIDIAFTPDLTLTKVTRTLILSTSLNVPVNYTLYTTIPSTYLTLCEDLISRPFWEMYLSYIFITLMTTLFLGTILIAVLDAESIKMQALEAFATSKNASIQPVLDLRKVGQQTKEEIQSTKDKKKDYCDCENDGKKGKTEPAIIPATGKAKKKLAQKNSCDSTEGVEVEEEREARDRERRPRKKEIMYERHRLKSRERRDEREMKMMEERERKERLLQQMREKEQQRKALINKKPTKSITITTQEEETSSTTTESSSSNSNCEDTEKENQNQKTKQCKKEPNKSKENINIQPSESAGKHVSFVNSKFKQTKVTPKPKEIEKQQNVTVPKECKEQETVVDRSPADKTTNAHHHSHNRYHVHVREAKKRENKARDKREKLVYRNKNERKQRTSESEAEKEKRKSPNSFYVPLPAPSTTSSVWGESRAKFSDVVARSETTPNIETTSTCSKPVPSTVAPCLSRPKVVKPTMYVEPYKATKATELGPIGSRRAEATADTNIQMSELVFDENLPAADDDKREKLANLNVGDYDRSIIAAISSSGNSFFSGLHDLQIGTEPPPPPLLPKPATFLDELTMSSENWTRQQEFRGLLDDKDKPGTSSVKMEDPWNDDLLNSNNYWSSGMNLLDSSESAPTSSTNYLWGSNPVWQPWAPPETPSTPRRTPPGFDQVQQRKNEQPQRDGYNPFGGIWTQNKPWNYDNQQ